MNLNQRIDQMVMDLRDPVRLETLKTELARRDKEMLPEDKVTLINHIHCPVHALRFAIQDGTLLPAEVGAAMCKALNRIGPAWDEWYDIKELIFMFFSEGEEEI